MEWTYPRYGTRTSPPFRKPFRFALCRLPGDAWQAMAEPLQLV